MSAAPRPINIAVLHSGGERIDVPLLARSGRHHIRVAREDRARGPPAAARPEVVDFAEAQMLRVEPGLPQQRRRSSSGSPRRRGDGRPADQFTRELERIH